MTAKVAENECSFLLLLKNKNNTMIGIGKFIIIYKGGYIRPVFNIRDAIAFVRVFFRRIKAFQKIFCHSAVLDLYHFRINYRIIVTGIDQFVLCGKFFPFIRFRKE